MNGKRNRKAAAIVLALATFLVGLPGSGLAGTPQADLVGALNAMHQWVGAGENGARWREYLKSGQLEEQLAKADQAEAGVLRTILHQYQSDANGLRLPRFTAVATALEAWLAEVDMPSAAELPQLARESKEQFQPVTEAELAAAKDELNKKTATLDAYLRTGGSNGEAWKTYLNWDPLMAQLGEGTAPDLAVLAATYRRFRANHEGLELDVFADVAAALRRYVDRVAMAKTPDVQQMYAKELDVVAEILDRFAETPAEQDSWAIGQRLGWFAGTGQAERLNREVRRHYSRPNLHAQVSAQLLTAGVSRSVDRTDPLFDVILGTDISGTTHTRADVRLQLIPHDRHAVLETVMTGHSLSDTVGRNGPVIIYSDGTTQISARKRLILDERGMRGLPATSQATTDTHVRGLTTARGGCFSGIIESMAWRRVDQSKSEAEYISARRAEQRVNSNFDAEAGEMVARTNDDFVNKFRNPLVRLGEFPQQLHFSTSEDYLYVDGLQANRFQIGAPNAPPEVDGQYDLAVRLHESLLNNLADALLAGRTFTEADVQKQAIELYGELPEKLKSDSDEEPWSITFARRRPVTVLITDGRIKVTMRGERYTSGEQTYQAMNATATYRLEKVPGGAKLTREGELEILPPGFDPQEHRLSAQQVALRRLMSRKLTRLFEAEVTTEGIELPGEWAKAGKLQLSELASAGGWLKLGWIIAPQDQIAQAAGSEVAELTISK